MNLGIRESTHDIICQWNDDVILCNDWSEIFLEIQSKHDFYLFNWKYGSLQDTQNADWIKGTDCTDGWCLCNIAHSGGEIVMNYGLYHKRIFREIGMYNPEYRYYYADSDMAYRAHSFGYSVKDLYHVKVCSLTVNKVAISYPQDQQTYQKNLSLYSQKILPDYLEYL
jgi:GT2 family glycosyltransferase